MTGQKTLARLIVATFVATIAFHPGTGSQAAEGRRVVIEIRGFEFVPERPVVNSGDVVVWKNRDIVPHTVTSKNNGWDSRSIEAGGEWETVITDDMIQDYYCRFHPSMIARVDITSR